MSGDGAPSMFRKLHEPAISVTVTIDGVAVKADTFLDAMKKIGASVEYMNSSDLSGYLAKQEETYKKIF